MSGYDVFCGWGDETAWSTPVARTQFARPYAESRADHIVPQDPVGARWSCTSPLSTTAWASC